MAVDHGLLTGTDVDFYEQWEKSHQAIFMTTYTFNIFACQMIKVKILNTTMTRKTTPMVYLLSVHGVSSLEFNVHVVYWVIYN